jgi:hypothetical protein
MPRRDKRILIAILAGTGLLLAAPIITVLVFLAAMPADCDEGLAADSRTANARGDFVAAYDKSCTGLGTAQQESVVLQLHGNDSFTTLVEYGELIYSYPKFRWINNDNLSIDLGKTRWVGIKTDKVGAIKITYAYSLTGAE